MYSYKFFYIIFISFWLVASVHAQTKGEWRELQPIPSERTEVAVTLLDKKIYVVGGFTQNGITDRVEVWDAENENWYQTLHCLFLFTIQLSRPSTENYT
jgi:hypothetical protein